MDGECGIAQTEQDDETQTKARRLSRGGNCRPDLGRGRFALYRLAKKSLGTPETIDAICRAWRLSARRSPLEGSRIATRPRGSPVHRERTATESRPDQFHARLPGPDRARRFDSRTFWPTSSRFVVRDLRTLGGRGLSPHCRRRRNGGAQLFRRPTIRFGRRFRRLCRHRPGAWGTTIGHFGSLWPNRNSHDRPMFGKKKRCSARIGGIGRSAGKCRSADNPRSDGTPVPPTRDSRGAFIRIPQHERRIYLEAFQSFLWNRVLAEWIRGNFGAPSYSTRRSAGSGPFYRVIPPPDLRQRLDQPLPLPPPGIEPNSGPLTELYERVAGEFGLECRTLRVNIARQFFLTRIASDAVFTAGLFHGAGGRRGELRSAQVVAAI